VSLAQERAALSQLDFFQERDFAVYVLLSLA
jgi:hypothetical protein